MFKLNATRIVFLGVAATVISSVNACGARAPSIRAPVSFELVDLKVQSAQRRQTGLLQLADASSFQGEIKGCASGYTKAISQETTSVSVQKNDINCFFRLNSIETQGETVDLSSVEDGSWAVGQVFDVEGSGGSLFQFRVAENLGSPITGAQSVSVLFAAPTTADGQAIAPDTPATIAISGVDNVELNLLSASASVSGADATLGFGVFDFSYQCAADGGATEADGVVSCGAHVVSEFNVGIVVDDFSADGVTLADCRTASQSGGLKLTPILPGSAEIAEGGGVASLVGPGQLYGAGFENLVVAVSSPEEGGGCQYVNITVQAP